MIKYFFLFLTLISLASCHKQLGGFQASKKEYFRPNILLKTDLDEKSLTEIQDNEFQTEYSEEIVSTEKTPLFENKTIFEKINLQENSYSQIAKNTVSKYEKPVLKILKKEAKSSFSSRNPMFNDSLKIGLVFLFIAIALAFFPVLLQLMLLFAVVSMVFLFIGLKKLFKWRAIEKKKKLRREKNEMRKEKIKDILN